MKLGTQLSNNWRQIYDAYYEMGPTFKALTEEQKKLVPRMTLLKIPVQRLSVFLPFTTPAPAAGKGKGKGKKHGTTAAQQGAASSSSHTSKGGGSFSTYLNQRQDNSTHAAPAGTLLGDNITSKLQTRILIQNPEPTKQLIRKQKKCSMITKNNERITPPSYATKRCRRHQLLLPPPHLQLQIPVSTSVSPHLTSSIQKLKMAQLVPRLPGCRCLRLHLPRSQNLHLQMRARKKSTRFLRTTRATASTETKGPTQVPALRPTSTKSMTGLREQKRLLFLLAVNRHPPSEKLRLPLQAAATKSTSTAKDQITFSM
ncbi:unnamed protein product [Amoebophrya sp. A120]|nr:unnamed protein product [Amoebophrya sp. A120]|eukprot:GSA120T00012402001.1